MSIINIYLLFQNLLQKGMAMAALEVENIPIITNITSFLIGVEEEIVIQSHFGFVVEGVLLVGICIC